jgi:hypothetical protein
LLKFLLQITQAGEAHEAEMAAVRQKADQMESTLHTYQHQLTVLTSAQV